MAEESFLLVSLQDEKAKKLSQVIGNKTARKILDSLAKKKYTESELAKELNMPISTVHYNLEQLKGAGLVKTTEYHYSSKGKEVNHYEIVNKLIIISPGKEKEGVFDLLKKFLPVVTIVGAISVGLEFYQRTIVQTQNLIPEQYAAAPMMAKTAVQTAADSAANLAAESAPSLMAAAPKQVQQAIPIMHYSLWFLIGGISVIMLMLVWELIKRRRKS